MELEEEQIDDIVAKLSEIQEILLAHDKETRAIPDMDVVEWNGTPIGRAIGRIQNVINVFTED